MEAATLVLIHPPRDGPRAVPTLRRRETFRQSPLRPARRRVFGILAAAVLSCTAGLASAQNTFTASFENAPQRHDGETAFTVELRFSEIVRLNVAAFDNGLLTITGGTLEDRQRVVAGSSRRWRLEVEPSGRGDVVITLPADGPCDPDQHPCTSNGGTLEAEASVTVLGPNQAPQITSASALSVAENRTAVATLTATDANVAASELTWSIPAGAAGGADRGRFTLGADGVLAFTSAKDFESPDDVDRDGRYEVTVQVSDGELTDSSNLTVTLSNVNEAPTAEAGPNQFGVEPGTSVTLSGSGSSDPDSGDTLSYAWIQTGGEDVTLAGANTAAASFTAPASVIESATFVFSLTVTDAGNLSDDDTVSVTVGGGAPAAPVITSASSFSAAENQTAVATLTATDADSQAADLAWSIPSGSAGGADRARFTLSTAGVLAFATAKNFESPDDASGDGSYKISVRVSDGQLSATANLTVTLTNVNEAPTADAGADQPRVGLGASITLSGAGSSDPDANDTLSYAWTQASGTSVTLANADTAAPSFTAPSAVGVLTFTLRVTDAGALFDEDTVTVTVPPLTAAFENVPARHNGSTTFSVDFRFSENVLADAAAISGGLVSVTGGSLVNQRRLVTGNSIGWQVDISPSGSGPVTITLNAGQPSQACAPGSVPCTSDGRRLSADVSVTVSGPNQAPQITQAREFSAPENGASVATLTGTDADTPDAQLSWSIPQGAAGGSDRARFTLSAAGVLAFTSAKDFENPDDANRDGVYEVTVLLSDGALSVTAGLRVALSNVNEAPTADARPNPLSVRPGAQVTLDGSGSSDPDANDTLSYAWSQTGAQTGTLTGATTVSPRFTAPSGVTESTSLTITLRVTDAGNLYDEDTISVTVDPQAGASPVITSASSFSAAENQTAVATLTATDADTQAADLAWSIPTGAAGGADRAKFTLSAAGVLAFASAKDFENPDDVNRDGRYEVTVRVSDGTLAVTSELTVTLTNVNEAPRADAGGDRYGIDGGTTVNLSGSASSDPDAGDTLSYAWTQTGGPDVTLSGAATATASFTAPTVLSVDTAFAFTLRVTDSGALYHEDSVTVTVLATGALSATFESVPQSHDGSTPFEVTIRFSENVNLTTAAFTNGLLTITGGTRVSQKRLTSGNNIAWVIGVRPAGNADVVITLPAGPANQACNQNRFPCTSDNRKLTVAARATVLAPNQAPRITSASVLSAAENQTSVAALTATDANVAASELAWSIPAGAAGGADRRRFTLSPAGVLAFTAAKDFENPDDTDRDGRYEVTVQVSDGELTDSSNLTVTLSNVNEAPTAEAGPNQFGVAPGSLVWLNGSGSNDPDAGDILRYAWSQTDGADVTLSNTRSPSVNFTAPASVTESATFVFSLTVTDRGQLSDTDTVSVTVGGNQPAAPVITSASSISAAENQTAVAMLTATDVDNQAADLAWSIPSGNAGGADRARFTLSTAGALAFASAQDFESPDDANADGNYQVTVQVSDGQLSTTANLTVTLTNVNEAPTADAGADQPRVGLGASITLSGAGSSDPDANDTLSYAWTQASGTSVTLANADTAYTFTLRVTDAGSLYHEDSVTVTVLSPGLLTAVFESVPQSHDGSTPFDVILRFSENVNLTAAAFTNGLLTITGGTRVSQEQVQSGSNIAWRVRVQPGGTNSVTIRLPAGQQANCAPSAVPCTSDGRPVSAAASATVQAALSLNLDTIAGDDTINIGEKAGGFTIGGDTGTEAGVAVTVTIGSGTTLNATSSDAGNGTATWSAPVPAAAAYIAGTSLTITVAAAKSGYVSPDNVVRTLAVDLTAPTVSVAGIPRAFNSTFTATFDFSEAVTGLALADINVGNGTASAFTPAAGGTQYTALVTPTAAGEVTVDVAAGVAADAAGNGNLAATQAVTTYDVAAPILDAISRGSRVPEHTNLDEVSWRVEFNEAVENLDAADFQISGTTATHSYLRLGERHGALLQVSGGDLASLDGTITLSFSSSQDITDIAGNRLTNLVPRYFNNPHYVIDNTAPAVMGAPTVDGTRLELHFNEPLDESSVPGADAFAVSVGGAAAAAPTNVSVSGTTVTLTLAAAATFGQTVTVRYAAPSAEGAAAVRDRAGNDAASDASARIASNRTPAGVEVSFDADQYTAVEGGVNAVVTVMLSGDPHRTLAIPLTATGSGGAVAADWSGVPSSLSFASGETSKQFTVIAEDDQLDDDGESLVLAFGETLPEKVSLGSPSTATVALEDNDVAGTLSLAVDSVADDDRVNAVEKAAGFSITGAVTVVGSGTTIEDASVTVTLGTTALATTSASDGRWTVPIPAGAAYIVEPSVAMSVTAAKEDYDTTAAVQRTLAVDLVAPTAPTYTAPESLKVGEAITAMSPSGGSGIDAYAAEGLPSGLSISSTTGVISGIPENAKTSTATATVTLSDTAGNTQTTDMLVANRTVRFW